VLKVLKVLQVLMVLLVLCASAAAQNAAPRDGVITGRVVDAATGRPVGAVIVSISGPGIATRVTSSASGPGGLAAGPSVPRVLTGADGRFMFRDLQAGGFTITAVKNGYAEGASGRRRPGGTTQPVALTEAQRTADISVRVWKNAAIGGTVVDEAGEPVVGVQVRALVRSTVAGRRRFTPAGNSAFTDDRGMYRFSGLLPGDYIVMASPPVVGIKLSVFEDVGRTGRAAGELAAAVSLGGATSGIPIGDALLTMGRGTVTPPPFGNGRLRIYPTTFHPAAFLPAQAATVTLGSGEERVGVDVQLQPVPTARVSGSLVSSAGPVAATLLRLSLQGADEVSNDGLSAVTFTDSSGAFTFPAVPPGQYTMRASTRPGAGGSAAGADLSWLDMPVTVSGDDVEGVVAVMRPALRITARLEFEGATPRPPGRSQAAFVGSPFMLETDDGVAPAAGGSTVGVPGEQGFTLGGYAAGRYRVRVQNSPAGWMFKSAMLNGVDVSETAFDFNRDVADLVLTFTDRWSGVSGSIQGAGAGGATVIVFPIDAQSWASPRRLKSGRATAQGTFGISSLPPGDYYAVAIPEEQAADWRDPKMLEELARVATRVSIGEGEHKTIDLPMKEVRR
jgi:hypothetical protein